MKESQAKQVTLDAITATLNFYSDTFPAWECRSTERTKDMSRNIEKMIAEGRELIAGNKRLEMSTKEAFGLYGLYESDGNTRFLRTIYAAYLFGLASGHKATLREKTK